MRTRRATTEAKTRKRSEAKVQSDATDEVLDRVSPAPPTSIFQTAKDQARLPKAPDLKRGFNEIAKKVFDSALDIQTEFDIIDSSLSIKGALTPAVLTAAANQSEDMARRAYRLYVCAQVEYEAYMRESEALVAAIRDAATTRLEKEKRTGIRTKMITDADVLAYCASQYPDEWEAVSHRRDRAKYMLKYLAQLSDLAKTRCFTVAKMLKPGGEQ